MPSIPPDWVTLIERASSPAIFAVLFIWYFVRKDKNDRDDRVQERADSKAREERVLLAAQERELWFRQANMEHANTASKLASIMNEMTTEMRALRNEMTFRLDAIERTHDH